MSKQMMVELMRIRMRTSSLTFIGDDRMHVVCKKSSDQLMQQLRSELLRFSYHDKVPLNAHDAERPRRTISGKGDGTQNDDLAMALFIMLTCASIVDSAPGRAKYQPRVQ
jgi:hypothetical protein